MTWPTSTSFHIICTNTKKFESVWQFRRPRTLWIRPPRSKNMKCTEPIAWPLRKWMKLCGLGSLIQTIAESNLPLAYLIVPDNRVPEDLQIGVC